MGDVEISFDCIRSIVCSATAEHAAAVNQFTIQIEICINLSI